MARSWDEPAFGGDDEEQQQPQPDLQAPATNRMAAAPQPMASLTGAATGGHGTEPSKAVDPLAFAPLPQATNAQGLSTPAPAPAQDGASWFGGPQALANMGGANPREEWHALHNPTVNVGGVPATAESLLAMAQRPKPPAIGAVPFAGQMANTQAPPPANPFPEEWGPMTDQYANPNSGAGNMATLQAGRFTTPTQSQSGPVTSTTEGASWDIPTQSWRVKQGVAGYKAAPEINATPAAGRDWFQIEADKDAQRKQLEFYGMAKPNDYEPGGAYAALKAEPLSADGVPLATTGSWLTGGMQGDSDFGKPGWAYNNTNVVTGGSRGDIPDWVKNAGLPVKGPPPVGAGTGNGSRTDSPGFGNAPRPAPQGAPASLSQMLTAAPGLRPNELATTPENALTGKTLSVGDTADRFKLAQDQWANFEKATAPQYQASLRDALRAGAAAGGLGSGQLRTSIGDLANQRALALDTQRNDLLNQALGGSIEDAYRNVGIAQQQQGFQNQQQQQAFQNELAGLGMGENLTQGAFQRALQQLTAGGQGNPADIQMALSGIFGNQASAAGQSLADLIRGQAAQGQQGSSGGGDFDSLLQMILAQGKLPGTAGYQKPSVPGIQPTALPSGAPMPPYQGTVTSPGPTPYRLPSNLGQMSF